AVLSAALPVRTLHAAESAVPAASVSGRDTSAYAPKLIDPKSPPPSEAGGSPVPAAPAPSGSTPAGASVRPGTEGGDTPSPAPARTPEVLKAAAHDGDDDVINRPAVDDIELQMNADVLKYIAFFTGAGRSTFERWLKRSGRYMDLFRSVLQKEGLPPDLVHLVFVESGFTVNARSY